jgi:CheY-like chemotaxis protein
MQTNEPGIKKILRIIRGENGIENLIIIVDDSEVITECMENHFKLAGYSHIRTFSNPLKALQYIREYGCPAFIITDFEMPEMNGIELLNAVASVYPEAAGLIVTGNQSQALEPSQNYPVLLKCTYDFFTTLVNHVRLRIGGVSDADAEHTGPT